MCEETDREGRGLENKWIYVTLLFVILDGQWYNLNALFKKMMRLSDFRIKMTRAVIVRQVTSNEST